MFSLQNFIRFGILLALVITFGASGRAQEKSAPQILNQAEAAKIVPSSFYFAGQSAPTQMRNSAVARLGKDPRDGKDRYVIVGLVDTSGYSTEISGKYEGFFITDSPISMGNGTLETGAYGFGFSTDGKLHIFDLRSNEIMSVDTINDKDMKRPRPLMMTVSTAGIRFYKGKNYALISTAIKISG